ncbi:MAG: hypothetical protein OXC40_02180 [Proteobacteria bacterium]|nr:hypothetical protein [Pseudomonadota bacterium]
MTKIGSLKSLVFSRVTVSISLVFSCLVFAGLFVFFADKTYPVIQKRKERIGDHPPLVGLPRNVINVMLLGQGPLYDDFIHLWTTQYLVDNKFVERNPEEMEIILRRIAEKKIASPHFYLMSCFQFLYSFKKPWLCEEIADIGIVEVEDSWMIPAVKGYAHIMQKEYLDAAQLFKFAANDRDGPDYVSKLGATLIRKHDLGDELEQKLTADQELSETSKALLRELQEEFKKEITRLEAKNQQDGENKEQFSMGAKAVTRKDVEEKAKSAEVTDQDEE